MNLPATLIEAGSEVAADGRVWEFQPHSVIGDLLRQPGAFDFFQAVSLIERIDPQRQGIAQAAHPAEEPLRFRAALGTAFPVSAIDEVLPPTTSLPQGEMTVALFGLTGPSGVLPRHYTQLLYRIGRDARGPEKHALRDWLDLFNHRLISLFYRAWKKYRFYSDPDQVADELRAASDPFATAVFSFAGLALPQLHNRLKITASVGDALSQREETVARVNDLSLLRYAGLLSQRPRTAANLRQLLRDYFGVPVEVQQFQGQWLVLQAEQQTRLGGHAPTSSAAAGEANNQLGSTAIAGTRVWDLQSKFRVRLGPLQYEKFNDFLPDRSTTAGRKSFFLLCHLTRLFAGPELDFDVQLVLDRRDVPRCQLSDDPQHGPRLGWNTWLGNGPTDHDAADAHFDGIELQRMEPL